MKKPADSMRIARDLEETGPGYQAFTFSVDRVDYSAYPGETIAAALYAAGKRTWRFSRNGGPRGLLCGIGVCFDCLVTVDGVPNIRACQVLVKPGMVVETNILEGGLA